MLLKFGALALTRVIAGVVDVICIDGSRTAGPTSEINSSAASKLRGFAFAPLESLWFALMISTRKS